MRIVIKDFPATNLRSDHVSIADELKFMWSLVWDPGRHAKRQLDLGGALKLYYTLAVFAFIAYAVVGSIAVTLGLGFRSAPVSSMTVLQAFATSFGYLVIVGGGVLLLFIAIPLSLLIDALLYQIVAKFFLKLWNGPYERTFTALVFSIFPVLLLYWLVPIPIVDGIFIVLAPIWSLVILVIALAAQQRIRRMDALLILLLKSFLIAMVLLLVGLSVTSAIAYLVGSVTHAGIISFPWHSLRYPFWNVTASGQVK